MESGFGGENEVEWTRKLERERLIALGSEQRRPKF